MKKFELLIHKQKNAYHGYTYTLYIAEEVEKGEKDRKCVTMEITDPELFVEMGVEVVELI